MHDIFYFTDVHGCYDLYRAVMTYCMKQDPECTIIYGGDACDRGRDGYRIMKELLDNPRVIYLSGNHEQLFISAAWFIMRDFHNDITADNVADYLLKCEMDQDYSAEVRLHLYNGGYQLLYDWMLDGMPREFVTRIANLPITFSYEHIDFCHAGGKYNTFERASRSEYDKDFVDKGDAFQLLWDRNYLGQGWKPNRICIFGHTPTIYLAAKYYGRDKSLETIHPCAYDATLDDKWTGRKIDMDTGAFASGKIYVLNILTMKAQGFKDKDLGNEEIRQHEIEKIEMIQF